MKLVALVFALAVAGMSASCSHTNNLLLGEVNGEMGGHKVTVTDCYRTSVPAPTETVENGQRVFHCAPCRDAKIVIAGNRLAVNGTDYGHINDGDAILVDHGVVKVNGSMVSR